MDYIDLRLGDFLTRIVQMADVEVYDTYDDTLLFRTRIGNLSSFDIDEAINLNDYGVSYVSVRQNCLEIGVIEI